jgi:hypothetical protein
MNNLKITLLTGLISLAALACDNATDPRIVVLHEEDGYQQGWERYRDSAVGAPSGMLVVEGDLYFRSEQDLQAYYDERMLEERDKAHAFKNSESGYIPAFEFPDSVDITYCVSNGFGAQKATWATRLADAARAWEKVVNVRFRYRSEFDASCSSSTTGVDFAMVKVDGAGGYCASNKMTWLGGCNAGSGTLEIDTLADITFAGAAPNATPTGAIRHELGHILGLRHEHPWGATPPADCNGEFPTHDTAPTDWDLTGEQLGSLAYDQDSVMHYPFDGTGPSGIDCGGNKQSSFTITNADSNSAQVLYGMHPAWIVALN